MVAALIATFIPAVESSIVATAMPTIVGNLGGFELFSWVFAVPLLTMAVTIPLYGRLADIYGRKRVFFVGTGIFLVGTTLCGFARSTEILILCRAIQGCGSGAVQPIAMTIIGDIYTPAERARVQGWTSSVFGLAAVIGPALGAFLVLHVGRWCSGSTCRSGCSPSRCSRFSCRRPSSGASTGSITSAVSCWWSGLAR